MTVPNDYPAPAADPALADVEVAGLALAAAYDSGDANRIGHAGAAYEAARAGYMAAAAHPTGTERQAETGA